MSNQRKGNNQRRNNSKRNSNNIGMVGNIKGLHGKTIKRFPVYIKDRKTGDTHVVHSVNALVELMANASKDGLENMGTAPMDNARALVSSNAQVDVVVTRVFGIFRIVSIENGVINLYPSGNIVPTTTWIEKFKPQVGRWVVRSGKLDGAAGKDGYSVVNDRIFKANYGNYMDPEDLASFNRNYDQVMNELSESKKKAAAERRAADAERAQLDKHLDKETTPAVSGDAAAGVAEEVPDEPIAAEAEQQQAAAEQAAQPVGKVGEASEAESAQHAAALANEEAEDDSEKNGGEVDGARSLAQQGS